MKKKMILLSELKLNDGTHGLPKNPRFIRDERFKKLVESIKDFPEAMPARGIVVDERGVILGGNMRYRACRELGMKEIPAEWIYRLTGLMVEQKRRFIIMDNRPMGEDDMDLLANEWDIAELIEAGFNEAELTGLMSDEPQDTEAQIDRAEELNKVWKCKTGDLWQIGEHRLYCGESEKGIEIIIGNYKPDIVITDPPYGINIVRGFSATDGGAKPFGRMRQPGGRTPKILGKVGKQGIVKPRLYHPIINDDKPFNPAWLLPLAKICILFGANHYASRLPDSPAWLVWDKGVSNESTFSACELIWSNTGNHIRRYGLRWSGMIRAGDRDVEMKDRIHPTQKPVALLENIIKDFTKDRAIIIDPYLGSGTTLLAAARTNRICVGGELDAPYCAVILQRMSDAFPGIKIEKVK